MKTIKLIFTTLTVAGILALTGCASVEKRSGGFDLSKIDSVVKVNQTTLGDVRSIFGTPTAMGTDADGNTVLAYSLVGHNALANLGKNMGKSMLTLGLGSKANEFTTKIAIFKFDANNKLAELSKDGWSFVQRHRFTFWNECEHRLTPEEINSDANYHGNEVCKAYVKKISAQEQISADKVDTGKEFTWCNLPCMAVRALKLKYPNIQNISDTVAKTDIDGSNKELMQW